MEINEQHVDIHPPLMGNWNWEAAINSSGAIEMNEASKKGELIIGFQDKTVETALIKRYGKFLEPNEEINGIFKHIYSGPAVLPHGNTLNYYDSGPFIKKFEHSMKKGGILSNFSRGYCVCTDKRIIFFKDDITINPSNLKETPLIFSEIYYEMLAGVVSGKSLTGLEEIKLHLFSTLLSYDLYLATINPSGDVDSDMVAALIFFLAYKRLNQNIIFKNEPLSSFNSNAKSIPDLNLELGEILIKEEGPVIIQDETGGLKKLLGSYVHLFITNKRLMFYESLMSGFMTKKETGIGDKITELPIKNIENINIKAERDIPAFKIIIMYTSNNSKVNLELNFKYCSEIDVLNYDNLERLYLLKILKTEKNLKLNEFHFIQHL